MLANRVAALFPELCALAEEAGRAILSFYDGDVQVMKKADNSPMTAADLAADAVIIQGLKALLPDILVITEETYDDAPVSGQAPFWLVDPLDGTKEFIAHSGQFTVNLGLIENGAPIIGVIHVPVTGETFWGGVGQGAWVRSCIGEQQAIAARTPLEEGLTVLTSRYHGNPAKLDMLLAGRKVAKREVLGSTLKFCTVAKGDADLYPHFGTGTREWDTAAGQAILEAAGGSMQLLAGGAMTYGKPELRNPPYLVRGR